MTDPPWLTAVQSTSDLVWTRPEPADDHNPSVRTRWVARDVAHLDIKRHEHSRLPPSPRCDLTVWGAAEALVSDGLNIMPMVLEKAALPAGKVLVELDPHPSAGVSGSGRISSVVTAAPYASAALTASGLRLGYSVTTSSTVFPSASAPRTRAHRDPRSLDTRLAVHDARIARNEMLPARSHRSAIVRHEGTPVTDISHQGTSTTRGIVTVRRARAPRH